MNNSENISRDDTNNTTIENLDNSFSFDETNNLFGDETELEVIHPNPYDSHILDESQGSLHISDLYESQGSLHDSDLNVSEDSMRNNTTMESNGGKKRRKRKTKSKSKIRKTRKTRKTKRKYTRKIKKIKFKQHEKKRVHKLKTRKIR